MRYTVAVSVPHCELLYAFAYLYICNCKSISLILVYDVVFVQRYCLGLYVVLTFVREGIHCCSQFARLHLVSCYDSNANKY